MAQESSALLGQLAEKESLARSSADELSQALNLALDRSQKLRAAQFDAEKPLEARAQRSRKTPRRSRVARSAAEGGVAARRFAHGGMAREHGSRQAAAPRRAAVGAGRLGARRRNGARRLPRSAVRRRARSSRRRAAVAAGRARVAAAGAAATWMPTARPDMLSGVVSGPGAIVRLLSRVRLAETLSAALQMRRELADDESVITRSGEWIGRDWLRVNRGGDPHSGVLEREQRMKQLRVELARSEENTREMETALATCREQLAAAERERDAAQSRIQGAHRDHADLLGQLEGERARSQESTMRRERLEEEAAEVTREVGLGAGHAGARPRRARPRTRGARCARFAPRLARRRTRGAARSGAVGAGALAGRAAREPRSADPHRIAPFERELDERGREAHVRPARADPDARQRARSGARGRRPADRRARRQAQEFPRAPPRNRIGARDRTSRARRRRRCVARAR